MQRGLHSLQTYYVAAIPKGKVNECERHMRFWHIKYEQHSSTACVGAMELQKYLLDQYLLMHLRNSRKRNQEHFNCLIWHPSHIVYSTLRGRRAETMPGKRKRALASQMSGHFYSAYIMPAGRPARRYFHLILINYWVERQQWLTNFELLKSDGTPSRVITEDWGHASVTVLSVRTTTLMKKNRASTQAHSERKRNWKLRGGGGRMCAGKDCLSGPWHRTSALSIRGWGGGVPNMDKMNSMQLQTRR